VEALAAATTREPGRSHYADGTDFESGRR